MTFAIPRHAFTFQGNLSGRVGGTQILPKFSAISPFGFSVTTDPSFCFPKNQVIPPKILAPSPPPVQAIKNDRSLITKENFVTFEHSPYVRESKTVFHAVDPRFLGLDSFSVETGFQKQKISQNPGSGFTYMG